MRWAAAGLLAGVLLWTGGWVRAAQAVPAPATVLRDAAGRIDAQAIAEAWLDPHGAAGIEQVASPPGRSPLRAAVPGAHYRLGDDGALWLHLRLVQPAGERQQWVLLLPMPQLDQVTVYQQEAGGWRAESAGDTLAVAGWPEPGRYPFFRLQLPPDTPRDVFVRIHHVRGTVFPVRLATAARFAAQVQREALGLGGTFGAMLLLILGCAAWSWVYRDPLFAWYAGYAGLTTLAVASFTGTAAHLLWPRFGALQDAPTAMLGCAAVASALLLVRNTLGLRRRLPLQDRTVSLSAAAGFALALLLPFIGKAAYLPIVGGYISGASLLALAISAAGWWRGDTVGRWVFSAQAPMVLAAIVTVFGVLGWATPPFDSQYLLVVGLAIEVPLLLVALFIRSRDRHSAQVREQALATQDALTGLLAPHLFTDRLCQVVARHRRDGEAAAVVYIDLVNHARIRDYFGTAVAEQSLLRSVIKLRRLLRDVDTASRVGEARFGIILEGASSRSSVTERATRLIAAGLTPLPGLKHDVTLQFHIAAVLLNELSLEADEIELALAGQLARMSPRTRRPIRFLSRERRPEGPDSSQFGASAHAPAAAPAFESP